MITLQDRLVAKGPGGELLSLLAGTESLEELRNLIIEYSEACPEGLTYPHSPFHILSGLSHASLTTLVNHLPYETCISLFAQELECRTEAQVLGCFPRKESGRICG